MEHPTDGTELTIELVRSRADLERLMETFRAVWDLGPGGFAGPELMLAIVHSGGYAAAVRDADGRYVAGSFGFIGRHHGRVCVHSHVTGVIPGLEHRGLGRSLKQHQRRWARDNDIAEITWTFDPLVRRNAWFNLSVLGARATEYHVDFYGPLDDGINAADESDRIFVVWDVEDSAPAASPPAPPHASTSPPATPDEAVRVETPTDIVALRRLDPTAAKQWRHRVRRELGDRMAAGWTVTGVDPSGSYVLTPPDQGAATS